MQKHTLGAAGMNYPTAPNLFSHGIRLMAKIQVKLSLLRAAHKHISEVLADCDKQRAESGKDNLLDDPAMDSARPSARGVSMSEGIPGMDRLSQGHLSRVRK
jgi:hypothetical protein